MNYDWLFSFVVFADHLNFTRAARALHITQPALHAQIRKLSEDVGIDLYRRSGRSLVLTPEGRTLAAFGREVQERGREVVAELTGDGSVGPVVLAAGQGALLYLLGDAIRRHPKGKWPLRVLPMAGPAMVDAIRDARAHVGVGVVDGDAPDLDRRELRRVGQLVMLPKGHRLSQRRRITPADLDGEALIVAPEGRPHRVMLSQALTAAGATWSVAVEASGWELMLQFARYGLGIAVVNDFCPVPRGFVGVRLQGVPDATYSVVTRSGTASEARERLVELILNG